MLDTLFAYSKCPDESDRAHRALSVPPEMPAYQNITWEDTNYLEWNLRPVEEGVTTVEAFPSKAVEAEVLWDPCHKTDNWSWFCPNAATT